jgi:hypothetical protein
VDDQALRPAAPLEQVLGDQCDLRLPTAFDPATLRQLLDVLEQRSSSTTLPPTAFSYLLLRPICGAGLTGWREWHRRSSAKIPSPDRHSAAGYPEGRAGRPPTTPQRIDLF